MPSFFQAGDSVQKKFKLDVDHNILIGLQNPPQALSNRRDAFGKEPSNIDSLGAGTAVDIRQG